MKSYRKPQITEASPDKMAFPAAIAGLSIAEAALVGAAAGLGLGALSKKADLSRNRLPALMKVSSKSNLE